MSEDLLKFILMRYRLKRREGKKMRTSWCGWGCCLIFLKVEMYPSHPPFCHNRLVFFILSNRFFPLKSWRRGGGNGHSGLKTNSLKNVGNKWKEAYSHGGSVSCHWPLRRAEIMCLGGFHKGYSFLDLWMRHEELPLARLGHPPKNHLHPPNPPQLLPPEPIAGMVRLRVQGSEKIKCMEYKGLNWIAFSLLLGEGSLGG